LTRVRISIVFSIPMALEPTALTNPRPVDKTTLINLTSWNAGPAN
jgi:hypothetical protein